MFHSPSPWPARSGRAQGSCHQTQRGLCYQGQALIPLLRWEVMHQSQSGPGKAWHTAGPPKGVVPGALKVGSERCWKEGTCCAQPGCTCHFTQWKYTPLGIHGFLILLYSGPQPACLVWTKEEEAEDKIMEKLFGKSPFPKHHVFQHRGDVCCWGI